VVNAEISHCWVVPNIAQETQHAIKGVGTDFLEQRIFAIVPPGQYDVETFGSFLMKPIDFLRAVLKISVHDDHPVTSTLIECRSDRLVLSEIADELDSNDSWVARYSKTNLFPRAVWTTVIDEYDLVVVVNEGKRVL
jgi:hypothetical protein